MSSTQALLWIIYRRHRWFLLVEAIYLLIVAALVPMLPEILRNSRLSIAALPDVGAHLAMPCILMLLHVIAMFSIVGSGMKDNTFSQCTFVLPIKTSSLALVHLLSGALAMCALWLFIACAVLRPTGNAAPLLWPMALQVLCLAVFQAIAWAPMAQPWMPINIAAATFGSLFGGFALFAIHAPEENLPPISAAVFGTLALLAGTIAYRGVAMARRGDAFDWKFWSRIVARLSASRKTGERAFASATRAQLWLECRQFAWQLPLYTALLMLLLVVANIFAERNEGEELLQAIVALGMPLFLAYMTGGSMGINGFTPFIAARPISSAAFVGAKFIMIALSVLASYAVIFVLMPLFLLNSNFYVALLNFMHAQGSARIAAVIIIAIFILPVVTWLNITANLWVGLTGRAKWVTLSILLGAILLGAATFGSLWLMLRPELLPMLSALIPWLVAALFLMKFAAVTWVLRRIRFQRLMPPSSLGIILALWAIFVAGLWLLAAQFIPPEMHSWRTILPIVLSVPITRLFAAPLAVEYNRHR